MGFWESDRQAAARVRDDVEFKRITALPRRVWTAEEGEALADELTELLRTDHGRMRLRPIQAIALNEIFEVGGLFGPIRVGAGKTLISLLAPIAAESQRPALLIPAALRDKTERAMRELKEHWQIHGRIRIFSYEQLGTKNHAETLDAYKPDLFVCDECHRLKNYRKAAVARRVRRFFDSHPETKMVALSGTITKRSLLDYAHLLRWCLKDGTPLPTIANVLETWADALDERKGQVKRAHPGVLVNWGPEEIEKPRKRARVGYRKRLVETPGVVATEESPIDASIVVRQIAPPPSTAIDQAFELLRSAWVTPDGHPIADGASMWRHANEIALGFYYVWDPRPPADWLNARSEWAAECRKVLSRSRTVDTEGQLKAMMLGGEVEMSPNLARWLAVEKDFTPVTVPVWIDDSVVRWIEKWARSNNGIIWVKHRSFGEQLSQELAIPYYSQGGCTEDGRNILRHPEGQPMIASIDSIRTGHNLQAWCHNLVACPPPNGEQWEQLMGRTHRDGQQADQVTFDVPAFCLEQTEALTQAIADSEYTSTTLGVPQKLLLADRIDSKQQGARARWEK